MVDKDEIEIVKYGNLCFKREKITRDRKDRRLHWDD